YKEGKILMWWRFKNGMEFYVFPGGTQEEGESIEETLDREVFEELNLQVIQKRKFFEYVHQHRNEDGTLTPRKEHYFLITQFEGDLKLGAPELFRLSKDNIYRPDWLDLESIDIDYD